MFQIFHPPPHLLNDSGPLEKMNTKNVFQAFFQRCKKCGILAFKIADKSQGLQTKIGCSQIFKKYFHKNADFFVKNKKKGTK